MAEFFLSEDYVLNAIECPAHLLKCEGLHDGGCNSKAVNQFINGVKSLHKLYLIVHLMPLILFKRKQLKKQYHYLPLLHCYICFNNTLFMGLYYSTIKYPKHFETYSCLLVTLFSFLKEMKKFLFGYIRSLLFSGGYSMLVRRTICFVTQHHSYAGSRASLISGFVGGISLAFQSRARQSEIALYCLNKSIETSFGLLKRRNLVKSFQYGEAVVFGLAMAIIGFYYQTEEDAIKKSYLSGFKKIMGEV